MRETAKVLRNRKKQRNKRAQEKEREHNEEEREKKGSNYFPDTMKMSNVRSVRAKTRMMHQEKQRKCKKQKVQEKKETQAFTSEQLVSSICAFLFFSLQH